MEDHDLVRQCLNGHAGAFGTLVDRYQKPLYNAALRLLNDAQDAEDITQTAFLKAYERLATYNPAYQFFSWIYRITVNESLNFAKRRQRVVPWDARTTPEETTTEAMTAYEVDDRVGTALMYLTPEDRALVLLKHVEGFSYDEIGYIFEIPLKTVKSRLYSARQRMRDILTREGFAKSNG